MNPSSTDSRHWSHSAIASTILAVMGFATLWLVVGLFLSGAAAVCGHVARHATASGEVRGRKLATFGVWLSYFSMLSFPILILIVSASFPAFDFWQSEKVASQREASQAKASKLFIACENYARSGGNRYPVEWKQLSGRFLAPRELSATLQSPYPGGLAEAFEIVPHDRPVLDAIADSVIVIQEIAPPTEPQIAVVFANGTVELIPNPDAP